MFEIRIAGTDTRFPCRHDQTILEAAQAAGIELAHSCRKGVCGSCAGTVISGETDELWRFAEDPAMHLFCQAMPATDLEIEPRVWKAIGPSASETFRVKVFRHAMPAPDVSLLTLRLPIGQRVKFQAGQHLCIRLADGSRRSYSMASPPHESDTLQLHIRHVPGGAFTRQLATLQVGDGLEVELPMGAFSLNKGHLGPMLCVVGGTGFAPVKSILDDMLRAAIRRKVTLVWGARDLSGLYLLSAVDRWKKAWPDFEFVAALEDAQAAASIGAFHGRVDEVLRTVGGDSLSGHAVYCCGSPQMVTAVRRVCLGERHLAPHHFYSDAFVAGPAA